MTYLDHPIVPKPVKVPDSIEVAMARKRYFFLTNHLSVGRQQPHDGRHFCPAATD